MKVPNGVRIFYNGCFSDKARDMKAWAREVARKDTKKAKRIMRVSDAMEYRWRIANGYPLHPDVCVCRGHCATSPTPPSPPAGREKV